jgi:hypothetical protein
MLRVFRKPFKYEIEGYEVLSCVKGGIRSRIFNSTLFGAKLKYFY